MSQRSKPIRLISCGIFRDEYRLLPEEVRHALAPVFLDSMLHMDPEKLDSILSSFYAKHQDEPVIIAYGDCCPHIQDLGAAPCTARTEGLNCCEIYLGRERYRLLRKARVFFLMPEWARRWERVVKEELGLKDAQLAREFMAQSMSRAVYIDTGVVPVPEKELADFSDYTGLSVTIEAAGPEHYLSAMKSALQALESGLDGGDTRCGR